VLVRVGLVEHGTSPSSNSGQEATPDELRAAGRLLPDCLLATVGPVRKGHMV